MIRLRLAIAILAALTAPALAQTPPSGGAPGFQPMASPVFQPMAPSSAPSRHPRAPFRDIEGRVPEEP